MGNERQVIYLKDKFKDIFHGNAEGVRILMNTLKDLNSDRTDMSKVTLDLQDVIINPAVEQLLYAWMEEFDLDVIDTTYDEKVEWNPETNEFETKKVPIQFRQDALDKKKRQLQLQKVAVKVEDYYVYDDNERRNVFSRESAKKIIELINERMDANNNRKLLLSIKRVNQEDEYSIRQLAAFLISAVNHIEVSPLDSHSTVSIYGILPAVSQLCYDFSMGDNAWKDIKNKHKVGSELYFSSNKTEYQKARVVKSDTHDENGQPYSEKEFLTEEDKEAYYMMYLEYDIFDEDGNFVRTKEFKLRASFVISREVLIFPVAMFEGGTSDGLPTKEELARNVSNNEIKKRKEKVIQETDAILLNSGGDENKDTDWIYEYKRLMRAHYKKLGIEIPKIDLLKIVKGEKSPFLGLNYGMDAKNIKK